MNAPTLRASASAPVLRIPPYSAEAEQSVLGALLLDNRSHDAITEVITAADFYSDAHRRIYSHITRLLDAGQAADVVTVFASIERSNEVEQTGGLSYLGEIANNTPSAAMARRYAEIVSDRSLRRALMCVGGEIVQLAEGVSQLPAVARIDAALGKVMALSEARPSLSEPELAAHVLPGVIDHIQQLYEQGGEVSGMTTGFADLDSKTTGLHPGDMVLVAGRPSMGKTAFALNIAERCALDGGVVAVFSMEMTKAELTKRMLSSIGRIELNRLRTGKMDDDDFDRLSAAMAKISATRLMIDDTGGMTLTQIRSRARRIKRQQNGLNLIVIDYIQLMESGQGGENRNAELTAISRGIKAMAKELHVPVIALSQLSRKVEERTNRRPILSDLRESGALEQDADLILMLYRDEYYKPDTQFKGMAEVIIGKQRNGPTGEVHLAFRGEHSRFANLAHGEYQKQAQNPKPKGFD